MMTPRTENAINVLARQLLLDTISRANAVELVAVEGISQAEIECIVGKARGIAANLAPSPDALAAAQRLLGGSLTAIPTPVPSGQITHESDTPQGEGSLT